MGRAPPLLRASLSSAALLKSSFSLAIRAVMLSSIWPLNVGSLPRGPLSEAIHLAWEAAQGTRRAALTVAAAAVAVAEGVAGAPRRLCRALRPSWDDIA